MNLFKPFIFLLLSSLTYSTALAQYEITAVEGYDHDIGVLVSMLEDMRSEITEAVKDLSQEQTDFLFDENANSIGSLIMHLVANEHYYYTETVEGRNWTEEEALRWGSAGMLGEESREKYKGKPITHYLDLWAEVRSRTLEGLREKDDDWLSSNVDEGVNNHWVWYHVMKHSANHMGQIALVKNRLPE